MQITALCVLSLDAPGHVIAILEAENRQKKNISEPNNRYFSITTTIDETIFAVFETTFENLFIGHVRSTTLKYCFF